MRECQSASDELTHRYRGQAPSHRGFVFIQLEKGVSLMSKTVAILIFPGVQSLDVTGPMDVFCEANRFLAPEEHYRLEVIGLGHGTMACSNGL